MVSIYHRVLQFIKNSSTHRRSNGLVSVRPRSPSKGRLLLSYLTAPFQDPSTLLNFTGHSNHWECFQIGQTFLDLGYEVDVINWDEADIPRGRNYSVCIDIHRNLERFSPKLDSSCIKILHITGAHWLYQNEAEYRRCLELQIRRGVTVTPRRQALPSFGIETADYATLLGNDFTESTFAYAGKKIFRIPVSSTTTFSSPVGKNFDHCRNRFLWLGGSGAVHKGLDRVLEAVASTPEIELSICGPVREETDFANAYSHELDHTSNIRTLGWTDIAGPQFAALVQDTVGLIYPTCSEGQAGSVITALHAGLIPLVSRQAGVTVGEFGFTLETCSVPEIRQWLLRVCALPRHELAQRALSAWEYARANHTKQAFETKYREAITQILKGSRR
jgi:glycosyltransferase involved in cell wall biosynthesis